MKLYHHEKVGLLALAVIFAAFTVVYSQIAKARPPFRPFFLPEQYDTDTFIAIKSKPYDVPDETHRFPKYTKTRAKPTIVELNTADSLSLVAIRGVGGYTATKILRYRTRLGGFYSPKQLTELKWGKLNIDSLLSIFTADAHLIAKRNIDTLEFKEILRHPYLEFEDVGEIFNAKRRYGNISMDTLFKYGILPEYKLKKIKYYFK